MGVAALTMTLGARSAWAQASWVMGATQQAPANSYFTEIVSEFQVPAAPPAFVGPVSIWPGVEGTASNGTVYVLQPVLLYFQAVPDGNAGWYMRNEVYPNGTNYGTPVAVNVGDWILGYVYLDDNNPGSGCNGLTGVNCNYNIGWVDLSNTNLASVLSDFTMPGSPTYAQGLVFETQPYSYTSCEDFPYQTSTSAEVELFTFTWGGLYTPLATNLELGLPTIQPKQFSYQSVGSSNNAYSTCSWSVGVGTYSTDVGYVGMGFSK